MMEPMDYSQSIAQGVERITGAGATTYVAQQCRAIVRRDDEGEYRVKLYDHARYMRGADYFTDDKSDAHGTAQQMVLALAKNGGAA